MNKTDNAIAIKVDHLTKVYPLYNSRKDRLKEALHPLRKRYHKDFYALKDISFEVKKGETVGIIGKNGSGKSTLLKILSGVLTPTSGSFYINGKVSSLLELGTGFSPELTGIENVYFYGMLLGFTKKEMDEMLPDILSFADIGEFVYQPVKSYSSGMYVRLAFSVAVNVKPDILIVDEALAVGDMRFVQKCIRKMKEIQDRGTTLLMVTHDTSMVQSMASYCYWFDEGKIRDQGEPKDVVKRYISYMAYGLEIQIKGEKEENNEEKMNIIFEDKNQNNEAIDLFKSIAQNIKWVSIGEKFEYFGEGGAKIEKVSLFNLDTKQNLTHVEPGEEILVLAEIMCFESFDRLGLGIVFKDSKGKHIFTINSYIMGQPFACSSNNKIIYGYQFKWPHITNGVYSLDIALSDGDQFIHKQLHWIYDVVQVESYTNYLAAKLGNTLYIPPEYVKILKIQNFCK